MDPLVVPVVGAGVACGIIGGAQAVESFGFRDLRSEYDRNGRPRTPRWKTDLSGRTYDDHRWDNSLPNRARAPERSDRFVVRDGVWHYNDENEEEFRQDMLEREGFRRPRPERAGTQPRAPARLGLKISQESPYVVEQIFTLMDPHGWKHWERGYTNPEIRQGDRLLAVDGQPVGALRLPDVNAKLGGLPYSVRTLTLQRHNASDKNIPHFEVTLVRHVECKRPPWTRPRDSEHQAMGLGGQDADDRRRLQEQREYISKTRSPQPPQPPYERGVGMQQTTAQPAYPAWMTQPAYADADPASGRRDTYTSNLYMTTNAQ